MYYVLYIIEGRKDAQKNKVERSPHYEKTSQPPHQRQEVAPGDHVRFRSQKQNAERRNPPVISIEEFLSLMGKVRSVCEAAEAMKSQGVTIGALMSIIDGLRQKLEDEKE